MKNQPTETMTFGMLGRSSMRALSRSTILTQELRPLVPLAVKALVPKVNVSIPSNMAYAQLTNPELERLRVVPKLKTFFGGNPVHEENINELNAVLRRAVNLPTRTLNDAELRATKFISIEKYREITQLGTRLKGLHFKELTQILHRLRSIDPQLMPKEVSTILAKYSHTTNESLTVVKRVKVVDEFGRAHGKAKRKESEAEVFVVKGSGEALVNARTLTDYFPRDSDRKKIIYPFQVISQEGQYNIFATVNGGGVSGQVEAVMYAISKALVVINPLLKPRLKKAGLMTSDARIVERKKPGKVKSRKSPTWVKR